MDLKDNATSLSIARIVIGGAAWAAPGTALKLGMLQSTPQAPYLLRLFGARDVALGAMALMAPAAVRPALLKIGVAVDGADAAAAALALKSGALRPAAGAVLAGAALSAVVAGVAALEQE